MVKTSLPSVLSKNKISLFSLILTFKFLVYSMYLNSGFSIGLFNIIFSFKKSDLISSSISTLGYTSLNSTMEFKFSKVFFFSLSTMTSLISSFSLLVALLNFSSVFTVSSACFSISLSISFSLKGFILYLDSLAL
ncbi:hypothetical protein HAHI6034_12875 [Hathewaya histolytica]